MTHYSKKNDAYTQFEIVDIRTSKVLFSLNEPWQYSWNAAGDCVLEASHHEWRLYVRDHPEWCCQ